MKQSKQEVGSPGFTDDVDARLDKIARLIATQHTKSRSKRMLLSLFGTFAHVKREREIYLAQMSGVAKTNTLAWADGFLEATRAAINLYLEKRFSTNSITFEEAEMLVDRPSLIAILELGPQRTNTAADQKTPPRQGADPRLGIRTMGDVQPPGVNVPG